MIVTIEVDKEQFDNVVSRVSAKKSEVTTAMSYDEKLRKDVINGRFFDGRVAIEKEYSKFCDEILDMLNKCTMMS